MSSYPEVISVRTPARPSVLAFKVHAQLWHDRCCAEWRKFLHASQNCLASC
jgi:hypothetical protein